MTKQEIQRSDQPTGLSVRSDVGAAANAAANQYAFEEFMRRKAYGTRRTYHHAFDSFADFLRQVGFADVSGDDLMTDPEAWRGMTWGIVETFVKWLLNEGYAISTVNTKLAAVKSFTKLAAKAGVIDSDEMQMIRTVTGYSVTEGRRVDDAREQTRISDKKSQATEIKPKQALAMMQLPDPSMLADIRDTMITTVLLEHGLRIGELVRVRIGDIDMDRRLMRFWRPKVDKIQMHRLTDYSFEAIGRWLDALEAHGAEVTDESPLLWGVTRGATLGKSGMSEAAAYRRVRAVGKRIGLKGVSPHDCRHYWATQAARSGTDLVSLKNAGGWSNLQTPLKYINDQAIANAGVKLR